MANLIRKKQVDQTEFSGFIVDAGSANFYPVSSNPSSYSTTTELSSTSGVLFANIQSTSGVLNTAITQAESDANLFSTAVSGVLSSRLIATGDHLEDDLAILSGDINSMSGALDSKLSNTSGVLNTKINTTSGSLVAYTNTVSGVLSTEISNTSTTAEVNSIASGDNFNFTGTKFFNSAITAHTINVSGEKAPTNISLTASSGMMSVVGQNGTFMSFIETGVGSNSNSLFAVNDAAGLAYLELFDNYKLVLGRNASQAIVISGVNGTVLMPNLPTSSAGLPAGAIYSDGGTLKIV